MRRLIDSRGGIYVEALVAIAVIGVALLPIIGAFAIAPAAQAQAYRQTDALNIARARVELLHNLTGAQWDALPAQSTTTVTQGIITYTVITEAAAPTSGLRQVRVRLLWTEPGGLPQELVLATAVARRSP